MIVIDPAKTPPGLDLGTRLTVWFITGSSTPDPAPGVVEYIRSQFLDPTIKGVTWRRSDHVGLLAQHMRSHLNDYYVVAWDAPMEQVLYCAAQSGLRPFRLLVPHNVTYDRVHNISQVLLVPGLQLVGFNHDFRSPNVVRYEDVIV